MELWGVLVERPHAQSVLGVCCLQAFLASLLIRKSTGIHALNSMAA